MSVEPPSSGRPTGPPSGPLSGPSQPPSGPPSGPPSQPPGGSSGGTPEPRRPWWRSVPAIALVTAAAVAAAAVAVVLTRPGGGGSDGTGGEVFLQAASQTGPDPFTESTATDSSAPPVSVSPSADFATTPSKAVRGVDGGATGLYGGSLNKASCDVEKQIKVLGAAPAKNRAFASVAGVDPSDVGAYLRSLTPVQLRMDTRVTNHGYRDGAATRYQAVLQTGTAVLVDGHGVPRVRCACGNPLTPPVAQQGTPKHTGDSWPTYRSSNVVVVSPSTTVINVFVLYDHDDDGWFARQRGDTGHKDRPTKPPAHPSPSVSATTPTAPTSPPSPSSPSPSPSSPSPPSPDTESPAPQESPSPPEPQTGEPGTEDSVASPPGEAPPGEAPPGADTVSEPAAPPDGAQRLSPSL
ncbi:DUF6777 domain-containing protein [Streptomyces sp. NPDC018693]|uniref:DUF6777 domain-containing protein n=1 Tax=unclassified Streptomyces TaxID=2593676 RepID=UPI0037A2C8A9